MRKCSFPPACASHAGGGGVWAELPVLLLLAAQALCYFVLGRAVTTPLRQAFFFSFASGRDEKNSYRRGRRSATLWGCRSLWMCTRRERERERERERQKEGLLGCCCSDNNNNIQLYVDNLFSWWVLSSTKVLSRRAASLTCCADSSCCWSLITSLMSKLCRSSLQSKSSLLSQV